MKQILTQIFVSLGVIFLCLLVYAIYFFIADPYGIKPLIFGSPATSFEGSSVPTSPSAQVTTENASGDSAPVGDDAPVAAGDFQLSSAQVQALISLGIDPAAVPSSISAEQEACFVSALGAARVGEIKNGAVPNALEFLKAKACI